MAATLTDAMKQDLASGNARILLIAQTDALTDTSFDNADELFTTNGSLAIAEGEPTKTQIKLDQNNGEILKNVYENGDTTIKGAIPSQALALYDYIYSKLTGTEVPIQAGSIKVKGTQYTVGGGYSMDKKIQNLTMFIESQSKNTAIIFMNVEFYAVMDNKTVNTTLSSFNFTATPIGGKFVVLKNGVPTT